MSAPHGYEPRQGDVILVRATVSRVTRMEDIEDDDKSIFKIAARTESDCLVRCAIGDIEKVEAFTIKEGSRVRWWGDNFGKPTWLWGRVLAVEEAEKPEDRPHKDNLWIKEDGKWPRLTRRREEVERG